MGDLEKDTRLLSSVKEIIREAKKVAWRSNNSILLNMYWRIGQIIVEDEQQGKAKAAYGKAVLKNLATQLTFEFGSGFDERNLNNMRAFFIAFPIWNAVRTELSWTHFKYSVLAENQQLFASKYRLYLPSEEELRQLIDRDRIDLQQVNE